MRRVIPFLVLPALLCGCQLERLFADDVGSGVARLTVRTSGAITALIEADENCGFSSEAVKVAVEGTPGHPGVVHFTVSDCELQLPERVEISRDCNGIGMYAQGTALVSATRSIAGTITGDPSNPVVPASADAVQIAVSAQLTAFTVEHDANPAFLRVHEGNLNFLAKPRLAVGTQAAGVCSVATPNVTLENVNLSRASVDLNDGDAREFPVDVVNSDFGAQIGVGLNHENFIDGRILVWDANVNLGKDTLLDTTYEHDTFINGYTNAECLDARTEPGADRIAAPLSYECKGVDALVADGAARLLVQDIGMIATLIEADASCGFATVEPSIDGAPGGDGSATWSVSECAIDLPADTLLSADCAGGETRGGGRVVVTASKTLTGRLTGAGANPVVPVNDTPATIRIESARMEGFTVGSAKGSLTLPGGTLSGVVEPRTARSVSTQSCSIPTRHVRVTSLAFDGPARAGVSSPQGQFEVDLVAAAIDAVNGSVGGAENTIGGSITVGEESYDLASLPSGSVLDTAYDAVAFEESFACTEDMVAPVSYECDFEATLAGGFARLSVNAIAQIASALEADDSCGFSSQAALDSAEVTGELGRRGGEATLSVAGCVLDFAEPLSLGQDCNGDSVSLQGTATVSGSKTLRGIVSGDPSEPIVPTTWDPATISVSIEFDGMKIISSAMPQGLEVLSGTLAGTLNPRTALDEVTGACSVPTPVAAIELTWNNAELNLLSGENEVRGSVSTADIRAVNGAREGEENLITGSLTLGGTAHDIGGGLNPDYDPSAFVASFDCQDNVRVPATVDECSFKKTLADGAARLVIQAVGEVARSANAEGGCAFSGLGVLTDPTDVQGNPGQQGSMTFEIEDCELGPNPFEDGPDLISEDCNGVQKFHQGLFTVSAQRHVTGEREEINMLFISADSIIPNSRDAVTVTLHDVAFDNFRPFHLNQDGSSADPGVLTLHSGNLSGVVRPVLGENSGEAGTYDVPTPVSALDDIRLQGAEVTLEAQGKTFKFTIDSTSIDAFNGSFQGRQNEISGTVTIDGEAISLSGGLDPGYTQADFDSGYSCNEDLEAIIVP
jgi:hypothetical protein